MARVMILPLLAMLSTILPLIVLAGPVADPGIGFALPFVAESSNAEGTPGSPNGLCVADSLKPGLNVIVMSHKGVCKAKTARTFKYEYSYRQFNVTQLSGSKSCSLPYDGKTRFGPFGIAVIGVEPHSVRVVPSKDDKSPIPKQIEAKARQLARSPTSDPWQSNPSSGIHEVIPDSPPQVTRAGDVVLMTFETSMGNGPPLLCINNAVFRLCGSCAGSPMFFSVQGRLYLTYSATVTCCGCGDRWFIVYDLSGPKPRQIYENGSFSD